MESQVNELPFRCGLSFRPLIILWDEILSGGDLAKATGNEEAQGALELQQPMEDISIREYVDYLLVVGSSNAKWGT
jgi:hypothetical protein